MTGLIEIHAAHAALAHAAAASPARLSLFGGAVGLRGESGILSSQMMLAAGGALKFLRLGASPDQLLKSGPAVVAGVFEDRHTSRVTS